MIITQDHVTRLGEKLSFYLRRWRDYPLSFPIEACNAEKYGYPTHQQAHIFELMKDNPFIAVHSGHNIGKSRLMAWEAFRHLLCYKRPGFPLKIPVTGPGKGGLSDVIWSEVKLVHGHLLPFLRDRIVITSDHMYVDEDPGAWFASMRTARPENPDALQGFHGDCLFEIDEGSGVPDEVYEVAQGAFAEEGARGLMFGNPTKNVGYFWKACTTGMLWKAVHLSSENSRSDTEYEYVYVQPNGNPMLCKVKGRCSPKWLDDMRKDWGEESIVYGVRVKGVFPVSGELDQVIRTDWIDAIKDRSEKDEVDEPIVMGVDIAYEGEDNSAYCVRQGRNILDVEKWHGHDPDESAEIVASRYRELKEVGKAPKWICVDSTGIGANVYAKLRKMKLPALPVKAQESAPYDGITKAKRIRDWLWWRSRAFYKDRNPWWASEPKDGNIWEQLKKELTCVHFEYKGAEIVVEAKKETKKRYKLKSPDIADAHNLTFFVDFKAHRKRDSIKKERPKHGQKRRHRKAVNADRWKVL